MKPLFRFVLVLAIASAGLTTACKKEAPEEGVPAAPAAEEGSVSASTLPAAKDVMAALDKKDYNGVIAGIMRARQSANSPEQMEQFTILVDEVKMQLIYEAPNDPKASGALAALRRITGGR